MFTLPEPPAGQSLDFDKVNVQHTAEDGARRALLRVSSAAECSNVVAGWYYDDPAAPTEIVVCPDTCPTLQGGQLEIVIGCSTVTG